MWTRHPSSYHGRPSHTEPHPASDKPVTATFEGNSFAVGGGAAIFHVASGRVVVCRHGRDGYWFLPKGRRDVGESTERGAEREGYEESGYRNRVLPLPLLHRQPQPRIPLDPLISRYSTEPVWMQLMPQTHTSQYMLFWYICETLPPDVEHALDAQEAAAADDAVFGPPYQYPPAFPLGLSFKDRLAMEPRGYVPPRHEGTSADEEEALYESSLLSVDEARRVLRGTVQEHVVAKGWEAIQARLAEEGIAAARHE